MHISDIGIKLLDMVANSKLSGDSWFPKEEPVGVSEISELLGVEVTTVSSWRQRHVLPRPDKIIGKEFVKVVKGTSKYATKHRSQ